MVLLNSNSKQVFKLLLLYLFIFSFSGCDRNKDGGDDDGIENEDDLEQQPQQPPQQPQQQPQQPIDFGKIMEALPPGTITNFCKTGKLKVSIDLAKKIAGNDPNLGPLIQVAESFGSKEVDIPEAQINSMITSGTGKSLSEKELTSQGKLLADNLNYVKISDVDFSKYKEFSDSNAVTKAGQMDTSGLAIGPLKNKPEVIKTLNKIIPTQGSNGTMVKLTGIPSGTKLNGTLINQKGCLIFSLLFALQFMKNMALSMESMAKIFSNYEKVAPHVPDVEGIVTSSLNNDLKGNTAPVDRVTKITKIIMGQALTKVGLTPKDADNHFDDIDSKGFNDLTNAKKAIFDELNKNKPVVLLVYLKNSMHYFTIVGADSNNYTTAKHIWIRDTDGIVSKKPIADLEEMQLKKTSISGDLSKYDKQISEVFNKTTFEDSIVNTLSKRMSSDTSKSYKYSIIIPK